MTIIMVPAMNPAMGAALTAAKVGRCKHDQWYTHVTHIPSIFQYLILSLVHFAHRRCLGGPQRPWRGVLPSPQRLEHLLEACLVLWRGGLWSLDNPRRVLEGPKLKTSPHTLFPVRGRMQYARGFGRRQLPLSVHTMPASPEASRRPLTG